MQISNLQRFFDPQSIAVVGVSEHPEKLGSIIIQNIKESGFKGAIFGVNPKYEIPLQGSPCVKSLKDLGFSPDLVIIAVPSFAVESVVDEAIAQKTGSMIIISAGFKEIGQKDLESRIAEKCKNAGVALLGPNCLGVIFPSKGINASFADGMPQEGNVCFISQSGAFCTAMLDWATEQKIGFSHFISLGNKAGLGENDLLEFLKNDPNISIFALYLESLEDGGRFLEILKSITPSKPVVILEPGKSKKASEAGSSHTGSLAPNFKVLQKAYQESGALQVESMGSLFRVISTLVKTPEKKYGNRVALITNAGGVGVLSTDLCATQNLPLPPLSPEVREELEKTLPPEASLKNPIDLIGDAKADRYSAALKAIIQDKNIDQILVLLTPQRSTEIEETARVITEISRETSKPIFASFIGGGKVEKMTKYLQSNNIPAFNFPEEAIETFGILSQKNPQKNDIPKREKFSIDAQSFERIKKIIQKAKSENLPSLDQSAVQLVAQCYQIPFPKSLNTDSFEALTTFAKTIWPRPLVLKISSPHALHKTELKGIILNIETPEKLKSSWESLQSVIKTAQIPQANIQAQEQITESLELILGINTDPNFGKIMLFGAGGIYTEVMQDTALTLLPSQSFEKLIDQTKISQIIKGVRGQKPKAILKLKEVMEKLEALSLDFPEIKSIDLNPLLLTEDQAICVDLKILI